MQADQNAYEDAQRVFSGVENVLATYDPVESLKQKLGEQWGSLAMPDTD